MHSRSASQVAPTAAVDTLAYHIGFCSGLELLCVRTAAVQHARIVGVPLGRFQWRIPASKPVLRRSARPTRGAPLRRTPIIDKCVPQLSCDSRDSCLFCPPSHDQVEWQPPLLHKRLDLQAFIWRPGCQPVWCGGGTAARPSFIFWP